MERFSRNMTLASLININPTERKKKTYKRRPAFFMECDEESFNKRFRLSKNAVRLILANIQHKLHNITERNRAITPEEMLLLTLRFYASGSFLIVVADFCGIGIASSSRIVKKVSLAIAELSSKFIKFPHSETEIANQKFAFHKIAKFPQVIGCIDCTHVRIQSPGGQNAEVFRNRKGYFSFNVQAVCNTNLEFLDLVCRWPGSAHDSNIFNNSRIKARLESNEFPHCFILGDSGYAVSHYMMTPLLHPNTEAERLYNESQIRTRNCIERCFGVWKRRFPILSLGIRVCQETTMTIVVATAVLNNIACLLKEPDPPELENLVEENIETEMNEIHSNASSAKRSSLIQNYFARL